MLVWVLKRSKIHEKLKIATSHHLNSSFQSAYWRQHGCLGSQTKTEAYQNLTCKAVTTFGFLDWLIFLHDPHHHGNRITQATDHLICDLASSNDQYLNLHRKDRKFAVTYGLLCSVVCTDTKFGSPMLSTSAGWWELSHTYFHSFFRTRSSQMKKQAICSLPQWAQHKVLI